MIRFFLFFLLLTFSVSAKSLVFGVFAYRSEAKMIQQYQPLVDHLQRELNTTIVLKVLSQEDLEEQVRQEKIDIVATNPTHFIALRAKGSLTGAIATEIKYYNGILTPYLGGVILTRADRHDIRTISDLRGKTIAIPGKKFLGGYQTQTYELAKQEIYLPKDAILHEVNTHEAVIETLLAGESDAGFVRTGIVEEMIRDKKLKASQFFIINELHFSNFPLKTSTPLYPEWAVAAATHEPIYIVKKIAAAIYTYTPNNTGHDRIEGFTIPADYTQIDALARELRIAPYEHAPDFTFEDVWVKYHYAIITFLASSTIIAVLVLFLERSRRKLRQSNIKLKMSQSALADLAVHDPLTGLFNRRGMNDRLSFTLASLARSKKYGALIYLDLDNFKPLNDSHGHAMGDALLIEVAQRLTATVRAIDTVARVGGDEFVVILSSLGDTTQSSLEDAHTIAEKIRIVLDVPYRFQTEMGKMIEHTVTASIGLVLFDSTSDADTLLTAADAAMYSAKALGRNQIVFGNSQLD